MAAFNEIWRRETVKKMITFLTAKYRVDDEWIFTKRMKKIFYDASGAEVDFDDVILGKAEYTRTEEIEIEVNEKTHRRF